MYFGFPEKVPGFIRLRGTEYRIYGRWLLSGAPRGFLRLRQVPPVIAEGFSEPDKVCLARDGRREVVPRDYARLL